MEAEQFPWSMGLILIPVAAGIACLLFRSFVKPLGLVAVSAMVVCAVGLGWQLINFDTYHHVIGGWQAPLGIRLTADGLSLLMLGITALVALAVSHYATHYFSEPKLIKFWPIWLFLLGALNALFLSGDIFNLYVTLELLGLSAVALTSLAGGRDALTGAMRYLLAALLGSLAYLLGVALLYHSLGTVDIELLGDRIQSGPVSSTAFALMGVGLILKTALFPLHFWLPPAHASAPAPVSAILSALVIKASFYILLRLWLEVYSAVVPGAAPLLGVLGAAAVLWGSLQALRQTRVKLLVAYSTIAQVGYLFMVFPLASVTMPGAWHAMAYLVLSHALAKAAMFLAAGNMLRYGGHDTIADLDRLGQRLPMTLAAFVLAGISIMGLPPSGGFIGKWLLLEAALAQQRWDFVVVLIVGGLMAAGYVFKVVRRPFTQASVVHEPRAVPAGMEWVALLLACAAILSGFAGAPILALLAIGEPFGATGVMP